MKADKKVEEAAMIDINHFRANQSRFPREQLAKYNGQYVAWSDDGTRILAANADPAKVDATLAKIATIRAKYS